MQILRYHTLGNDDMVIDPEHVYSDLSLEKIYLICHRNYGIGLDGILLGPMDSDSHYFALKIFNANSSEMEKSEKDFASLRGPYRINT